PSGCDNTCGSTLEDDECGVCNGSGPAAGFNCEGVPLDFAYNQSTEQAFYYFYTVTINGDSVNADDWVGAFKGDVCVGSLQWDISMCNSNVCSLPIMGRDDTDWTAGYLEPGDFPSFKIYDSSNNEYFDALPSEDMPFEYFGTFFIDSLAGGIMGCTEDSACNYNEANTVEDGSCEYAEENYDCEGNCIISEDCAGVCGGSAELDECGVCGGDDSSCMDCADVPNGDNVEDNCGTCDNDSSNDCDMDCSGDWGGSLEYDECGICNGDGAIVECWDGLMVCDLSECSDIPTEDPFTYNQSLQQAFYYFISVTINGMEVENDDWVGAFNGETCVGARKWDISLCGNGICDVPVMGDDSSEVTVGYMNIGEFPTFKIYDASENTYYDAVPDSEEPWENFGFYTIPNLNGWIWGCTDLNACNYNEAAIMDDGNCLEIDCAGECGGSAALDECGVCGGNGTEDGFSCDGIPLEFVYNQSSLQAFYYINETSDLTGDPLTAEDWVGIFNGETCVGSRQWDTTLCNSGVCDVPAMGYDGYDYSEGYLLPGDLPSFKIYDYSEGDYFDAYPSENYPYENAGIFNINELVLDLSYSIPLTQYNNLMSFYVLPEDVTVGNVMLDIQENIVAISGEATSAQYFFEEDYWTGTLMNLDIYSGYWMRVAEEDTLDGSGHSYDPGRVYNLHSGANLVSFPSIGSVGISEGLPDEIEENVLAVLGAGMSTVNSDGVWEGSLLDFKALQGYWIITDEEISFSYNLESLEPLSRKINPYLATEVPYGFDYIQSTQQAFYYVEDIKLINGEIENGDWLFSYCGNTVTGARQWLGRKFDIPAMGTEGDMMTAGYCGTNDSPHFKLLKSNGQELIALHAETPKWQPNGIFFLGSLEEAAPLPNEFAMFAAYPNPFNPITQIRYEIPAKGNLEISIFDLRGQKVETLVNKFIQPGEYIANWDASHLASGVYFVHFTTWGEGRPPISQIQKLMLVK
ncbi:T9SS C-terminal target domain-containing protein, partial [Candidatus Marinimicrobia bacterium PRS2]